MRPQSSSSSEATLCQRYPNFQKKTVVSRNGIGDLTKEYAEKQGVMSQPRRMLTSSFHLVAKQIADHHTAKKDRLV